MNKLKSGKILIAVTSVFAFLKAVLSVMFAFMLKTFLDFFAVGTRSEISYQMIVAVLFLLLYLAVELAYNYFESRFITKRIGYLKTSSMQFILKNSILNFNKHHSGEFLSLLTNDAKAVEDDYFGSFFECLSMGLSLILSVIALIYLNTILGVVSVLCSILSLIVPVLISSGLNSFRGKYSKQQDYLTRKTKSILDGFETIKTYDVESVVAQDYSESVNRVEHQNQLLKFLLKSSSTVGRLMGYLVFFTIIFTGLFLSVQGKISFSVLLASIQLSNNLVSPIVIGVQMVAKIRSVRGIRDKISALKSEQDTQRPNSEISFERSIILQNVSFSYDSETMVLKNITLQIEKGKKYAVVGGSGSGKSTLGKVLMGICDHYTGEILIDNNNARLYNSEAVIRLYSLISQNTFLIDDTIEKNVSFYKSVSSDRVVKALNEVQLSRFINTGNKIGENGILLSGGERQRISLARAFVGQSPIILSDEATSQLDNENMLKIENLILNSDKTVITITHRLIETILRRYDTIFVLSDGKLAESGTFDDLIEKRGLLYSLYYISGNYKVV